MFEQLFLGSLCVLKLLSLNNLVNKIDLYTIHSSINSFVDFIDNKYNNFFCDKNMGRIYL